MALILIPAKAVSALCMIDPRWRRRIGALANGGDLAKNLGAEAERCNPDVVPVRTSGVQRASD
jgi:hypothetical protein